ncbi:MAG: acetamidase/formamidase family protein [Armatimonadota bacterium]
MHRELAMPSERIHYRWDNALPPALEVDPGDIVHYDLQEVSGGQITRSSTAADLARMDMDRVYPLAGPVFVKGARPGDVLVVDILDLRPGDWGWTAIIPGLGLLAQDFTESHLRIWDLGAGTDAAMRNDIHIPLDPFCGTMGVATDQAGTFPVMPPGKFGGNMDIRHLTRGTTLLFPVWVDGALFSCGDAHAVQGDGEVCISAIEAPMRATLRFGVRKDLRLPSPQFVTPGPLTSRHDAKGYYATTGIAPDLMEGARAAVRAMIDHLVRTYRLSRQDAYILCSVAVDLKISEVVDVPNWVVSAYLPLSIFR